ncbi:MAG TPA: gamma-glutamyltransferase, partial [Puia sp.]
APGKRMLSSMTPTIVLDKGAPYLITGTPGGTTITTSVFQTIVDILDFHLTPEEAVNKPKFHHQWLPDTLYVEKSFPSETLDQLKTMGYTINKRGAIGRTELIQVLPAQPAAPGQAAKPRQLIAIGDSRGDDTAEGY